MTSKILVADDSPTIQKIVALAFENDDIEVRGVGDGQEAWRLVEDYQPDIVLADVDMPGLSGFDLSRKIKSSAKHQGRWVILLSSDFEEFDEEAFQACAAEDHLSKPFKTEDIIKKVQNMLSGDGIPNSLDAVEEESPPAVQLSAEDIEEDAAAPVMELSSENMIEEENNEFELSADDLIDELLEDNATPGADEVLDEALDETVEEEPEPLEPGPVEEEEETAEETEETMQEVPEPAVAKEDEEEPTLEDLVLPDEPEPVDEPELEPAMEHADPTPGPADENESAYTYLLTDDQISDFDESRVPDENFSLNPDASAEAEPEEAPAAAPSAEFEEGDDETSPDFILGEIRQDPDPVEDLENAFRAVTGSKKASEPEEPSPQPAAQKQANATPDLIQESRAFLAEKAGRTASGAAEEKPVRLVPPALTEENLSEAMVQHAARVLEAGLDRNLKRELAGISEQVNRVVREVVQEMAPDIIREVIRKEIQEIRNMEEV
ncbi:MAG: response regulator [Nitrospina sp.]|nr:response regulator [Nitrospina sp.]